MFGIVGQMPHQFQSKQILAVADESARHAVSRQTCCKQRWTLSVMNLLPKYTTIATVDISELQRVICRKLPILIYPTCIRAYVGGTRFSFAEIFGSRKLESPWAILCRCCVI